ncbi:SWR1 complex subunit vps71 [Fulvia fulva]|uniref:SWR1 complex subunit vps71 n=1 Tax=Passalora fulva TaxID=5499 RepID=A0A9Q8PIY1_PASFU|nr:SWR1 complex subunit vps71 [Fulvia fulva]KAK4612104.1 SWR1 complex subunit vps71 [Fulvia fulva]KAK4612877.1 SWR1 complex subunit vps71 [Fulvia fulva]UJO23298.1 SWR1 complex subunit vps71 [Fulvia fulva]WPV21468.1 SWR1 complex subunit vps71 [Fulvia fulva]WPV35778.1 SWR1 complex subunit vps71 [Fulvia fulva]
MATGALRFRTPHIEELPIATNRQAPGFTYVAVSGPVVDPSKDWGTTNRKRSRTTGLNQSESQKEALSARQQREVERKIKDLNSDSAKDVQIPIPKKSQSTGGLHRAGKTPGTKKILASGKTFAHYLDDEEAEIARTGRRDGDVEPQATATHRASKTPLARRKPQREESSMSGSPAPSGPAPPALLQQQSTSALTETFLMDVETDETDSSIPPLPSQAEMDALLNAPPLTYNQARSAPPPASAPPPRKFCEICGYWGRVKCMKCGNMTCSVHCKDTHDEHKCLKFYA